MRNLLKHRQSLGETYTYLHVQCVAGLGYYPGGVPGGDFAARRARLYRHNSVGHAAHMCSIDKVFTH